MLIVTKDKKKQTEVLNEKDFEAVCLTMKALDKSFTFFNAGRNAGASQDHKHLQVVPLQSLPGEQIPIHDKVMEALKRSEAVHSSSFRKPSQSLDTSVAEDGQRDLDGDPMDESIFAGNLDSYPEDPFAFLNPDPRQMSWTEKVKALFSSSPDNKNLPYDEIVSKFEDLKQRGETLFILPEFQNFKHIFRKIDCRVMDNLRDDNLEDCSKYLYRAYL